MANATNYDVVITKEVASAEFASTCRPQPTDTVRAYVEAVIAPATRRAYKADLERAFCARDSLCVAASRAAFACRSDSRACKNQLTATPATIAKTTAAAIEPQVM